MPKTPQLEEVNDVLKNLELAKKRIRPVTPESQLEMLGKVASAVKGLSAQAEQNFVLVGELADRTIAAYKKQRVKDAPYVRSPSAKRVFEFISRESGIAYASLRQYRSIVRYYGGANNMFKLQRSYPTLRYSHFRLAKSNRTLAEASDFLAHCHREKLAPDDAYQLNKIQRRGRLAKPTGQVTLHGKITRCNADQFVVEYAGELARQRIERFFTEDTKLIIIMRSSEKPFIRNMRHDILVVDDELQNDEEETL